MSNASSSFEFEIVRLGAVVEAQRHRPDGQKGRPALELSGIAAIAAAEAEKSVLVGLGLAQGGVDQQPFRQEQLAGRQVIIRAAVMPAADGADDIAAVVHLVLYARRHLRRPAVLVEDRVAEQADLGAQDVLIEFEALAQAEAD